MRKNAKLEARNRLLRMEGQIRGLVNMVEDDRDCAEVLTQVAAIRAALEGFGSLVVMHQMETVLAASGVSVRDPEVMDRIDQMRSALERLIR